MSVSGFYRRIFRPSTGSIGGFGALGGSGEDISAPGWADMALTDWQFAIETVGRDRVSSSFHGPNHEEARGVSISRTGWERPGPSASVRPEEQTMELGDVVLWFRPGTT